MSVVSCAVCKDGCSLASIGKLQIAVGLHLGFQGCPNFHSKFTKCQTTTLKTQYMHALSMSSAATCIMQIASYGEEGAVIMSSVPATVATI